jgi:glucose/arabinose dehydrogenase
MRTRALILFAALAASSVARAQSLQATLFQSGFSNPIFLCAPPGDLQRVFVVEQSGKIRIVRGGATLAPPYLDLGAAGLNKIAFGGEQGLLGLAFHPNYASNGYFYVNYTAAGTGATVIERYQVSANPDVANGASGAVLLTIGQPQSNHNGGCIQFGLDGKLYIGMGDGGGANDQGTGHAAVGNGQSPQTLLGKMLRIDVDLPAPYVPPDNPYFGSTTTLQEIWHFGVRNPWRWSFDRLTGDMYIGDVGQGAWEEVSFGPNGVGALNFGWRCMEGNHCTGLSGCTCNAPALTNAIAEYSHSFGCAITGGYVYRGTNACGLQGTYFYADYCTTNIWSFRYVGGQVTQFTNRTAELEPAGTPTINNISSFGEDGAGELYICDHADGEIYRIDPAGGLVDCNGNGIADACDIVSGTAQDCNANWIPDSCEIASGAASDCNGNGVPDSCDLAAGTSLDVNANGIPDECECPGGVPPTTYCSAKINSQFCSPAIAISGYPSASSTSPCVVSASQVLNLKLGMLFYGYASAAIPYQNGTLCVQGPWRRTTAQNSGGSPTGLDCTGAFAFDVNAWIQSGADPALAQPGQPFFAQYWSRDPQDPYGSSFTNAVRAQICQ